MTVSLHIKFHLIKQGCIVRPCLKEKNITVHLVGVLACICEHNITELEIGGSHSPGLHLLQSKFKNSLGMWDPVSSILSFLKEISLYLLGPDIRHIGSPTHYKMLCVWLLPSVKALFLSSNLSMLFSFHGVISFSMPPFQCPSTVYFSASVLSDLSVH